MGRNAAESAASSWQEAIIAGAVMLLQIPLLAPEEPSFTSKQLCSATARLPVQDSSGFPLRPSRPPLCAAVCGKSPDRMSPLRKSQQERRLTRRLGDSKYRSKTG